MYHPIPGVGFGVTVWVGVAVRVGAAVVGVGVAVVGVGVAVVGVCVVVVGVGVAVVGVGVAVVRVGVAVVGVGVAVVGVGVAVVGVGVAVSVTVALSASTGTADIIRTRKIITKTRENRFTIISQNGKLLYLNDLKYESPFPGIPAAGDC